VVYLMFDRLASRYRKLPQAEAGEDPLVDSPA
jgi:hypothetical protein